MKNEEYDAILSDWIVCTTASGSVFLASRIDRDRTMFSCLADRQSRILLEPIAEYHKLNIVAASTMPSTGNITFDLGVHLSWRIFWHQDFLLWQGPDERVFFIPEDLDGNVRFWIEDGDLYSDKGLPFANSCRSRDWPPSGRARPCRPHRGGVIMASKTTKKMAAPKKRRTATAATESPAQIVPLSHFTNGGGTYERFDFTRF